MDKEMMAKINEAMKANGKRELTMDEMGQVVGGSDREMAELKAAIHGNPHLKSIWDKYMDKTGSEFDATAWTVTEVFDLGFTASSGSDPNLYDDDLTHEQVLSCLKNYPK